MTLTDLLKVVPTSPIQTDRNKLLRNCCHQYVNNFCHVLTISDLLEQFVASLLASSTVLACFSFATDSRRAHCRCLLITRVVLMIAFEKLTRIFSELHIKQLPSLYNVFGEIAVA